MKARAMTLVGCLFGSAAMAQAAGRGDRAGIKWLPIPGGTFLMGSADGEADERPLRRVTVSAFEMAKSLVTFKQYRACVEAGACAPAADCAGPSYRGDEQPVVCVDWNQAKAFSEWVGGRLPSEAEWEYAARSAGKAREYPWGKEHPTCERAVFLEDVGIGSGCGRSAPWPVCSKPKGNTEQGLCDMAGNVSEWVEDWYHGSYAEAPVDGSPWEIPRASSRVLRGGSWHGFATRLRTSHRDRASPDFYEDYLGFRPVRARR